jgi:threonine aldolase
MKAPIFTERLAEEGVLCGAQGKFIIRFVLHRHISGKDVQNALGIISKAIRSARTAP